MDDYIVQLYSGETLTVRCAYYSWEKDDEVITLYDSDDNNIATFRATDVAYIIMKARKL